MRLGRLSLTVRTPTISFGGYATQEGGRGRWECFVSPPELPKAATRPVYQSRYRIEGWHNPR